MLLLATVLLLGLALADDDEVSVEDHDPEVEKETEAKAKREEINKKFHDELFADVDPAKIGKTEKLSMDDFTEKNLSPTERNETEKARDANSCGRALECGGCLDQGCAWCLNSEECIADVAVRFFRFFRHFLLISPSCPLHFGSFSVKLAGRVSVSRQ